MNRTKIVTFSLALAALGLGGIVSQATLPAAAAQDGQDQQGPPPPMGQQGPVGGFGGPGGPGGFRGGRPGGMAGGGRFATGTVSAVDPMAKTITVTSPFGGTQTIQASDTTQVVSQATANVADLKVGDHIQVQGVPTGISASTLTIGENPLAAGQGGGPGQGGFGGGRQGGGPGGQGGPGAQPAFASATGTVTATSPLTISFSTSVAMTLKLDPTAKVTKFSTVTLSSIKTGDQIVSTGQAGDGGMFTATMVGVNVQMGGGRGGFGGGQGFGGRGGPGGFGGGQGGPQGGAPMPPPDSNA